MMVIYKISYQRKASLYVLFMLPLLKYLIFSFKRYVSLLEIKNLHNQNRFYFYLCNSDFVEKKYTNVFLFKYHFLILSTLSNWWDTGDFFFNVVI